MNVTYLQLLHCSEFSCCFEVVVAFVFVVVTAAVVAVTAASGVNVYVVIIV